MSRKPKTPKTPGKMRHVLAATVQREIDRRFPDATDKVVAFSKESGIPRATIQRVLKAETGASIDTIEQLAAGLKFSTHQLLIPDDSLVMMPPVSAKVHRLPARPGRVLINPELKPLRKVTEKPAMYVTTKKRRKVK